VANLNSWCHTVLSVKFGDLLQAVDVAIFPDAGAAMGNAAVACHSRCLNDDGSSTTQCKPGMMSEMPGLDIAVDRLVLAHGRHNDAILQDSATQRKWLKQSGALVSRHSG
jgi:hypothetical protein